MQRPPQDALVGNVGLKRRPAPKVGDRSSVRGASVIGWSFGSARRLPTVASVPNALPTFSRTLRASGTRSACRAPAALQVNTVRSAAPTATAPVRRAPSAHTKTRCTPARASTASPARQPALGRLCQGLPRERERLTEAEWCIVTSIEGERRDSTLRRTGRPLSARTRLFCVT